MLPPDFYWKNRVMRTPPTPLWLLLLLLAALPGCAPDRDPLDAVITAENTHDFTRWRGTHENRLPEPWRAEFARSLIRLQTNIAYGQRITAPAELEPLLLRHINGATPRAVLSDGLKILLKQHLILLKVTEQRQDAPHLQLDGERDSRQIRLTELAAEAADVRAKLTALDPNFDYDAFAAQVVAPPFSGSRSESQPPNSEP